MDEPLEWRLRTLLQVCHAVHFGHCRGIVHRDPKPGNGMVGSSGEVYVMDGGIIPVSDLRLAWAPLRFVWRPAA